MFPRKHKASSSHDIKVCSLIAGGRSNSLAHIRFKRRGEFTKQSVREFEGIKNEVIPWYMVFELVFVFLDISFG